MDGFVDVKALAELICPKEDEDQNFDDEQKVKPYASISKKSDNSKRKIIKENSEKEETKIEDRNKTDIEDYLEKTEYTDWRKNPEWCVAYKQKVTPSDMFLQVMNACMCKAGFQLWRAKYEDCGMSGKTPATSSCEEMIITINLPGEQSKSIDVKVTENHLDMTSSMYRLSVPLPHTVDPRKGNEAKWFAEQEQLKIILCMNREFDYVNF